jgi:hypothetical protein
MYAVDPIGSCGQSAVQSASVRRDDPALFGEQLTEDRRTMRDTGSKTSTLSLAVGRCAACMLCNCPNRCLQSRNGGRIRNRHISAEPHEYPQWASRWSIWSRSTSVISSDIGEPFLRAGARSKAHPAPVSKFLKGNLTVGPDPW